MCYLYIFCLHCCLINIHIFDYPDSRLSGLFTEVPTSPDNRGSTVPAGVCCAHAYGDGQTTGPVKGVPTHRSQKKDISFEISGAHHTFQAFFS